jgi:hypothetical protein
MSVEKRSATTPVILSNWLNDLFQESIPLATTLSTEKARSEFIIAPLLFELRKSLAPILVCSLGQILRLHQKKD